ncbi:aKG-HExxH-type peptide beta-hydroxylase [Actinoplanes sp. URMC 104]|uniref:aKG-HExxH-type peptide beta-hydroxylase n=1 Tax=Actinoplanes sp. URMC 104 TaxID=3423409 RepID=UPI003F1AEA77
MRTFRLSDTDLVALAAGRPSPATLGLLRRAQLSRHLLQLRSLPGPPAGRDPADPMAALHTATRLAGATPPDAAVVSTRFLTASHAGLRLRVRLEDTDPLRERLGLTPTDRLTDEAVARWQRHLDDAWRLLADRHRPAAATLARVLSVLVPVEPDPGAGGISATSADAFGAVAISAPADATSLAVGLLHEAQHSLLNALRVLFDLVEPSPARGYSPWRDDPRPAFGILHGAYAYQSVARFWRTEAAGDPLAAFEFARWRSAVVAAADDLLAGDLLAGDLLTGGLLTPVGRRFTGALRDEVAPWLGEPVDPDVARLAAGANLEHRVRWRLRNLTVDPGAVNALARAWETGAVPPAVPPPQLRAAARRELSHSERLTLTHRYLRGRSEAAVRPGDAAYLRGDHDVAADAYAGDVAGLALVAPLPALRERPEVVRALWRRVGGDLRAVAEWVGGADKGPCGRGGNVDDPTGRDAAG